MRLAARFAWVPGLVWVLLASFAGAEEIKFAVIGDYGDGAKDHGVDRLIAGRNPDFVITVGDNAYSKDKDDRRRPQNAFEVDVVPSFGTFIEQGNFCRLSVIIITSASSGGDFSMS